MLPGRSTFDANIAPPWTKGGLQGGVDVTHNLV
jgi:hypothetical protein